MQWDKALTDNPLILILRGLDPERAIEFAETLIDSGFRILEVPMYSPDPLVSIERIASRSSDEVIIAAGTV